MLSVYRRQDDHLVPAEMQVTAQSVSAEAAGALWIDLINPSRSETSSSNACSACPSRRRKRRRRTRRAWVASDKPIAAIIPFAWFKRKGWL